MRHPTWRDVDVAAPAGPIAATDWGGDGDPVLLLHGGGSNAAEWSATVPHLVDGFRCISFDSAGHGRSPEPDSPSFGAFLDEIVAVIEHFALDTHRLTLVGSSFGGALAVWWASTREACRAVVGVDSAPMKSHLEPWPHPGRVDRTPDEWRAMGWGWSGDETGYEERVRAMVADGDPEAHARRARTLVADGRYEARPTPELLSALGNLGNRAENPIVRVENYARLCCPTLLLCANDGVSADNREFIDAMPERFPGVEVRWMDGPHTLNYAHPELVAMHIRRFVAGLGHASSP